MTDRDIKSIYEKSTETPNNIAGLLKHLQTNPEEAEHILHLFTYTMADVFIDSKGENGFKQSSNLWNLIPETFADGLRKAILRLKFRTPEEQSRSVNSTSEILHWLKETYPEILIDAEAEESELHSKVSSPEMKKRFEQSLKDMMKRPDQS